MVESTIDGRYSQIFSVIFEIKSVIEGLRMQTIGGIKCGKDIWEMAIIPSLINNASKRLRFLTNHLNNFIFLSSMTFLMQCY